MRIRTALISTLLAALSGCAACDSVPDEAVTDCDAQISPGGAATDILFVVDDSGSMSQEQEELAANLGAFIDALVNAPVRLDVRVGVTNTSVEDYTAWLGTTTVYRLTRSPDGAATGFPVAPGTPYPRGTLVAIEQLEPSGVGTAGKFMWGTAYDDPSHVTSTWGGPRIVSNGPTLARDFKANVLQGTWGSGKEQPLEAMRAALDKASCSGGVNCGFQRDGARLAVVVLTDEDDCSSAPGAVTSDSDCHTNPQKLTALDEYVDYLGSTAFDAAGPPIFALIAGFDPTGETPLLCRGADFAPPTSTSAYAVPNRLNDFVGRLHAAAPGRTLKRSICGSFGPALLAIANMIIPQTMPLEQAPEDWRMLAVAVNRGGTTVPCRLALAGADDESADAVFTPPQGGAPASLRFQGERCTLAVGDRVDLRIVCAR